MGLRTARGKDNLPGWLLSAADNVVRRLDPSQYPELYRLASNARQTIMGSASEWRPFESILLDARIDRSDRNHVTALVLALMPRVLKREKDARAIAIKDARARMAKAGVEGKWSQTGKFEVSEESAASINESAERLASALDRLAKK